MAKVRSEVKEGRGRLEKAVYFPPQITCGSHSHIKGQKEGGRHREGDRESRKREKETEAKGSPQ